MNQKNDNFIDKTFTVLADVLIKILPATKDEKKAFSYFWKQSSSSLESLWAYWGNFGSV